MVIALFDSLDCLILFACTVLKLSCEYIEILNLAKVIWAFFINANLLTLYENIIGTTDLKTFTGQNLSTHAQLTDLFLDSVENIEKNSTS